MDVNLLRQQAAWAAARLVRPGMVVGLGGGATAALAIRHIAELVRTEQLRDIVGIPCSLSVEREARRLGISLTTLEEHSVIDLTIDGADEVDPELNLIKGAGGALLREKIVAQASRREVIVVDESKLVPVLGSRRPVPIEATPFGYSSQIAYLESLGARVTVVRDVTGEPRRTDQDNLLLFCEFGPLGQPHQLAQRLSERAGIVEHGLFLEFATDVIVATEKGLRHLVRNHDKATIPENS